MYDNVLYPDELLKDVGGGVYMLASAVMMPADGDITHSGSYLPVVSVAQLDWSASWESYDRARRRLNFDALWERGGDMSGMVRNFIFACILATTVFVGIGGMRASDSASRLAGEVSDVRGLLYRQAELQAAPTPRPGVPPTLAPSRP
jgi:hypothetical protein